MIIDTNIIENDPIIRHLYSDKELHRKLHNVMAKLIEKMNKQIIISKRLLKEK